MNFPFSQQQLESLDSKTVISFTVKSLGQYNSYELFNNTPAFWYIYDDSGGIVGVVPPWTFKLDNISLSQQYIVKPNFSLQYESIATIPNTQYTLGYSFSAATVTPLTYGLSTNLTGNSEVVVSNTVQSEIVNNPSIVVQSGTVQVTNDVASEIINEQVGTGFDYQNFLSIDIPAESTPVGVAKQMNVLPEGQQMSAGAFWVGIDSANNYEYAVTLQPVITFTDGTQHDMGSPLNVTLTNSDGMSFLQFASSFDTLPVPLNGIIVTVTQQNASQDADTVSVYLSIPGQALPDENSVQFPKAVDPTFTLPGASSPSDMRYNAVPLPVQQFVWDGSEYVGTPTRQSGQWNLTIDAGGNTEVLNGQTINKLYRIYLSCSAGSVKLLEGSSTGAILGWAFAGNPLIMDWDVGLLVYNTLYLVNDTSSALNTSFLFTYD